MAINDQLGPDAEYYDYNYYQSIVIEAKDTDRVMELRAKAQEENPTTGSSGMEFAGAVAKKYNKIWKYKPNRNREKRIKSRRETEEKGSLWRHDGWIFGRTWCKRYSR